MLLRSLRGINAAGFALIGDEQAGAARFLLNIQPNSKMR